MFDMKELERGMKMAQERETIRVIGEDGTEQEYRAKIWTLCGIDSENRVEFVAGKVALVGDNEIIAEAVTHAAQLKMVAADIMKAIVETVPGMTQKKFMKLLKHAEMALLKSREEKKNA